MATKAEEMKVLEMIRSMVEKLGPDSYVGTALDGCLDLAETNIKWDAAFSMRDRWVKAEEKCKKWHAEAFKQHEEVTAKLAIIDKLQEELEAEKENHKELSFKYDGICFNYSMLESSTKDIMENAGYWKKRAEAQKSELAELLEENKQLKGALLEVEEIIKDVRGVLDI